MSYDAVGILLDLICFPSATAAAASASRYIIQIHILPAFPSFWCERNYFTEKNGNNDKNNRALKR